MSLIDKQYIALLDRMHIAEVGHIQRGHGIPPCRWEYVSKEDLYRCTHMEVSGKTLLGEFRGG
jgi:hypothetical protein